jgi:TRAP-type C4-dicarboxylate transport system permease small subunit
MAGSVRSEINVGRLFPWGRRPMSRESPMLDRALDTIAQWLLVIAAILAFCLSFIVAADVIGRVVFNHPLQGTPEMVSSAIVIICYLQASYAVRSGGMISLDAITWLMPLRARALLAAFGALLGVFLFGLIFWGSIDQLVYSWTGNEFDGEGALRIPAWPARFVLTFGSLLTAICYALLAQKQFTAFLTGEPPVIASTSH